MENLNAHTNNVGERVASVYADTYFDNDYCDYRQTIVEESETSGPKSNILLDEDDWKSPSDRLIGIVVLTPPFTSKITRGIAHQGILAIGNAILERERGRFDQYINKLLNEHEFVWNQILDHQKNIVQEKVTEKYKHILASKCNTLMIEIHRFYESSLQDLEDHMRQAVTDVLNSTHAKIVCHLNIEIKEKLKKEKDILTKVLEKKYASEVKKVKHYYQLLLDNESDRFDKVINQALHARNDALKAFYRQIEAETTISTMYVMCTERKKCRIKQFLLDNYHSAEVAEKLKLIKDQEEILDSYKVKDVPISKINKEWEDKMKKILQLFLKFISFSLKLLPEQTTFLLDLEKMVVLQLNEIQKSPAKTSSILVDEEEFNHFEFVEPEQEVSVCDKDPFVLVGDTAESISTPHGSRETLASNVGLPVIRLQRQFIYAKCDKHEEVKALLEAKRCKCMDYHEPFLAPSVEPTPEISKVPTPETESSFEHLLMGDNKILQDCPARHCQDWAKKFHFPYMLNYLDYTDHNYRIVQDMVEKSKKSRETKLVHAKELIYQDLPFAATHEKYHDIGTQYSSQEDLSNIRLTCRCTDETKLTSTSSVDEESISKEIERVMKKRKDSLNRLIHHNPNLLKIFTEEDFDFVYTIK